MPLAIARRTANRAGTPDTKRHKQGVTICLIKQKGGCGKTSTCFHLAGCFAQSGLTVLPVDAEPAGLAQSGILRLQPVECLEPSETLAAVFSEETFFAPESLAVQTPFENISLIRANQHLAPFNST